MEGSRTPYHRLAGTNTPWFPPPHAPDAIFLMFVGGLFHFFFASVAERET